jgi:hypothetical protein
MAQFMSLALLRQHALAKERKKAMNRQARPVTKLISWNPSNSVKVTMPTNAHLKEDPKHDLESFVWVILYALCIKEMHSQITRQSKEEYYSEYFNPIFGAISFEDTHKAHTWTADRITDTDDVALSWRENRLSGDAWVVLDSLVQSARDGILDHQLFKEILEYYIMGLKQSPTPGSPSLMPPESDIIEVAHNGGDNASM